MQIVCPGCEQQLIDSHDSCCNCGRCPCCGLRLVDAKSGRPIESAKHKHEDAEIKNLERNYCVPPGREAEVRRAIELRKSRRMMRIVLYLFIIIGAGNIARSIFDGQELTGWKYALAIAGLIGGLLVVIGLLDRILFWPPLPVGEKECRLGPPTTPTDLTISEG